MASVVDVVALARLGRGRSGLRLQAPLAADGNGEVDEARTDEVDEARARNVPARGRQTNAAKTSASMRRDRNGAEQRVGTNIALENKGPTA